MSKEENVVKYYVLCNKLKNVIRTGWLYWNVTKDRVESVAEHIYGVQMLALAMKSEYQYDVDIMKVMYMLAIHELGEIVIGDKTLFDMSPEEKTLKENEVVHNILSPLMDGKKIEEIYDEFNARETKEAKFAYQCDKFEADLQSKLYDQEGCVDLSRVDCHDIMYDSLTAEILSHTSTFSEMWLEFGQRKYPYDENFMAVSQYVKEHDI